MPGDMLPQPVPDRPDADTREASDTVSPVRSARAESPVRSAHRNRIKALLKAARMTTQTA